jgi:hypothetical protein
VKTQYVVHYTNTAWCGTLVVGTPRYHIVGQQGIEPWTPTWKEGVIPLNYNPMFTAVMIVPETVLFCHYIYVTIYYLEFQTRLERAISTLARLHVTNYATRTSYEEQPADPRMCAPQHR